MEEEDVLPKVTGSSKRRHGEVSRGQIKWQKEDDIQPQKRGHSPTVSWRIQNPEGFYSEDWNEVQFKIGMKKTNGKHQISGRKSHGWCFMAEV